MDIVDEAERKNEDKVKYCMSPDCKSLAIKFWEALLCLKDTYIKRFSQKFSSMH